MYTITNNLLRGDNVTNVATSKKSKNKLQPKFLVIHYTAGDNYAGDVKTLSTGDSQVSCHLVIGPKGEVTQVGNFTDVLWHAGQSGWKGYTGLNSYAIGIEVTNPGPVDLVSDVDGVKTFKTWYGKKITDKEADFVFKAHKNGGAARWWCLFTPEQIQAVIDIGSLLMKKYGLLECVGHDDISPGRKQDPGPSCPDQVFSRINGRGEPKPEPITPVHLPFKVVVGVAPDTLNVRNAPKGDITGKLPEGTRVTILDENDGWAKIKSPAGYIGWVSSTYLKS